MVEEARGDTVIASMMDNGQSRQALSTVLRTMPIDSNGVPFNGGCVVASGNLAADMFPNVMPESTGRLLATRRYEMTDGSGM